MNFLTIIYFHNPEQNSSNFRKCKDEVKITLNWKKLSDYFLNDSKVFFIPSVAETGILLRPNACLIF